MWIHNIKSNEGRCKGGEGRGERLMGNKRDHDTDLTRCIRHGGKHKVSRYLDGGIRGRYSYPTHPLVHLTIFNALSLLSSAQNYSSLYSFPFPHDSISPDIRTKIMKLKRRNNALFPSCGPSTLKKVMEIPVPTPITPFYLDCFFNPDISPCRFSA
ncbi:hypothetical protein EYC84_011615 [Monilinia fructicola]|uniref:Uncharacterized protein n=1 Tax=Monilinia fructicola TaxID=38448 RepID=A0A5M9J853_MONFR|nr:hypothetical protein EYC84_011615 [Monilinia fructicola]